ncbi:S-layer family protein [Aetokthonos hydrillicola Thurmond2011]|uniref:S-layer family protein n=1 Tax=Aetokthonos hydrillicola Thurmond2011 TaxID=2712845 RepID=A0AAP5I605_9CYAN|nr:S-layer family protein [Aetokthonos hydrillicola]MBW4584813.1 S-layer family protein [Aetokthonos hydrillicola CCALA 1050]MDR9895360.1 S-layer family protein [Aetokthonos hydrillicola Thurmond2011]
MQAISVGRSLVSRALVSMMALPLGILFVGNSYAHAQVTSDGTTNTIVNSIGNNFTILNGIEKGNNLFHSFTNFSVPRGGVAKFDLTNTPNITTIFSRVTGGNVSDINGIIQTLKGNHPVSLFLMNPHGIVFGKDAALNIGGSFVGTTANSIKFADGTEFSAVNANATPLLTMSVPIGLQMGLNPGGITVQGSGNQLIDIDGFGTPSTLNTPPGLQVEANRTLALIGGSVNLSGGVVTTNGSGHLEVGSVSAGQVGLKSTGTNWIGDYSAVQQFNDIHLAQQSLLDASGSNGSIQLQGRNISLSEGSAALIQNFGTQPFGGITIHATGSLNLLGNTANNQLGSFIQTLNFGTGQGGYITISAGELSLKDGAVITTAAFTEVAGGNITANVSGTSNLSGFNRANPVIYSALGTFSVNRGNAGNILLSTGNLQILDSAAVTSVAAGSGQTGTIQVDAADQIEIAGYNPMAFSESSLSTFTQGSGNANRTVINTSRLVIQGGASVGSSTLASGSAGSVEVNASKSIDIEGRSTQGNASGTISRIFSNAEILSPAIQAAFELPAIPTGNSGSLTINTPLLRLIDGGAVSVKNDGPGIAGDLLVNANSIFLDKQGNIIGSTASGNGGNIHLNLQDYLLMRHDSLISVTATGKGNGGNLSINSPVIAGLENSDIIANAVQGRGGNINITTQGIIGLEFRNTLTPSTDPTNDITASSQFNVNGTVQVNNIGINPNTGLIELPTNVNDSSQQIAARCSSNHGSSFVVTRRGGVPQNPILEVRNDHTWSDTRDLSEFIKTEPIQTQMPQPPKPLVQATSWHRRADGKIELVAAPSPVNVQPQLTCAALHQS